MRDEIARKLYCSRNEVPQNIQVPWDPLYDNLKAIWLRQADEVLAIMRARIKALDNPYAGGRGREAQRDAFEAWRFDMLGLFSEGADG